MKPGDLCKIVNPVWQQLSDSDVCMILKPVISADGMDIYAVCDWWVLWDSRETAWAASDLEVIDECG
jgi:hypothetical protein